MRLTLKMYYIYLTRACRARSSPTVRAVPGRLSALSVFLCKSVLYVAFVWARRARRARNSQKRRFPARAVRTPWAVDFRQAPSAGAAAGRRVIPTRLGIFHSSDDPCAMCEAASEGGGLKQSTFCMVHRKSMITMGSPYFVWLNTNEIISSWYLLGAVCVTPPPEGRLRPVAQVGNTLERFLSRSGEKVPYYMCSLIRPPIQTSIYTRAQRHNQTEKVPPCNTLERFLRPAPTVAFPL
jgi:hypothetical protein